MASPASILAAAPDGVLVRVRVTPKASRNGVTGYRDTPAGLALGVAVTTVPEDGKANAAVIKLLAKEWKTAKGDISVTSGTTSRDKVLKVAGDSGQLSARLALWLEQFDD